MAYELLDAGCRLILAGRDISKLNKIKKDLEDTKLPTTASWILLFTLLLTQDLYYNTFQNNDRHDFTFLGWQDDT